MGEGLGHVVAAVTEADVVRFVINGAGKKEDTGVANKLLAEGLDLFLRNKAGEADGAGVGRCPSEEGGVAREERRELAEIAKNNLEIAIDEFLAVAKGKGGKEFAGGAGTDRSVVLEGDDFLEEGGITAGEPA